MKYQIYRNSNTFLIDAARASIIVASFNSLPAMAQQPLAEYTVKLTPAQLDTIGEGLGFMPFNKAAPLINALREQVMAQQPKPEVPKVEAPKEQK